jgi:hypothetical protein
MEVLIDFRYKLFDVWASNKTGRWLTRCMTCGNYHGDFWDKDKKNNQRKEDRFARSYGGYMRSGGTTRCEHLSSSELRVILSFIKMRFI